MKGRNTDSSAGSSREDYIIVKSGDVSGVIPLFVEGDLEFSPDAETIPGLHSCYELLSREDGERIGGAAVTQDSGEYVLKGIAIKKEYQNRGLGKMLMARVIEDVSDEGAAVLYLTAKIPEYYKQFGFRVIDSETAPPVSGCLNCHRFRKTCNPEIMKLDLI